MMTVQLRKKEEADEAAKAKAIHPLRTPPQSPPIRSDPAARSHGAGQLPAAQQPESSTAAAAPAPSASTSATAAPQVAPPMTTSSPTPSLASTASVEVTEQSTSFAMSSWEHAPTLWATLSSITSDAYDMPGRWGAVSDPKHVPSGVNYVAWNGTALVRHADIEKAFGKGYIAHTADAIAVVNAGPTVTSTCSHCARVWVQMGHNNRRCPACGGEAVSNPAKPPVASHRQRHQPQPTIADAGTPSFSLDQVCQLLTEAGVPTCSRCGVTADGHITSNCPISDSTVNGSRGDASNAGSERRVGSAPINDSRTNEISASNDSEQKATAEEIFRAARARVRASRARDGQPDEPREDTSARPGTELGRVAIKESVRRSLESAMAAAGSSAARAPKRRGGKTIKIQSHVNADRMTGAAQANLTDNTRESKADNAEYDRSEDDHDAVTFPDFVIKPRSNRRSSAASSTASSRRRRPQGASTADASLLAHITSNADDEVGLLAFYFVGSSKTKGQIDGGFVRLLTTRRLAGRTRSSVVAAFQGALKVDGTSNNSKSFFREILSYDQWTNFISETHRLIASRWKAAKKEKKKSSATHVERQRATHDFDHWENVKSTMKAFRRSVEQHWAFVSTGSASMEDRIEDCDDHWKMVNMALMYLHYGLIITHSKRRPGGADDPVSMSTDESETDPEATESDSGSDASDGKPFNYSITHAVLFTDPFNSPLVKLAKNADLSKYPLPKRLRDTDGRKRQLNQLALIHGHVASTNSSQASRKSGASSGEGGSYNAIVSSLRSTNLTANQKRALRRQLGGDQRPQAGQAASQQSNPTNGNAASSTGSGARGNNSNGGARSSDYYATMVCYNCGRTGHPSRLCPDPPTAQTLRRRAQNATTTGPAASA